MTQVFELLEFESLLIGIAAAAAAAAVFVGTVVAMILVRSIFL